jgi:hypothetical protein
MQMITREKTQNHPDGELLARPQNKSCDVLQVSTACCSAHESLYAAVCGFGARCNVGFVFGLGTIALILTVITWSVQHAGETLWTLLSDKISLQV